jgi:hypothetical protein
MGEYVGVNVCGSVVVGVWVLAVSMRVVYYIKR